MADRYKPSNKPGDKTRKCDVCGKIESEDNKLWGCNKCDILFCEEHVGKTRYASRDIFECPNWHKDAHPPRKKIVIEL